MDTLGRFGFRFISGLGLALCGLFRTGLAASAVNLPTDPARGALVWSDEFNQPSGSSPDPSKWRYDLGGNGWGNRELENYVNALPNCRIVHDNLASDGSALAITAIESATGYTSARIKTRGRFSFTYGHVEARLRMPSGKGIWPAFWLLGDPVSRVHWPACGEIDIMENLGSNTSRVYGTLHGPGYSGSAGIQSRYDLQDGGRFDAAYHVFAVDWAPGSVRWSVDGHPYQTLTPSSLPKGAKWVFDDAPFFIILNLAVGGGWPGNPDQTTKFPQSLYVDYVRVYKGISE